MSNDEITNNISHDKIEIEVNINNDEDIILARQKARLMAQKTGFGMLDQTRIVTAVSEIARNIVVHAKEGKMTIYTTSKKPGIKTIFEDHGPGIANVNVVMQEGFSTTGSLGVGLKGAKRLMDEFKIDSTLGKGTIVTLVKWLPQDGYQKLSL